MDEKLIDKAAELFRSLELNEIEIEQDGCKVVLKKSADVQAVSVPAASAVPAAQDAEVNAAAAETQRAYRNCKEIKAPIVGVFYSAKSPDSDPFVCLGSKVKKGDVVCILEAMKMMNEIRADEDGTVLDVCAENGSVVEYGQTLFKLG